MARRPAPGTASTAHPAENGRLTAPSALRNAAAICEVIATHGPARGRALELASGTGEHAVRIAAHCPGLRWQPSEIAPDRRASIDAWAAEAALPNLAAAIQIDATHPGWGARHGGQDLIFCSNILHLISAPEAECLIREAATALAPGGVLMIYGPFRRDHGFASDGDAAFHASLIAQDPQIGYKSVQQVQGWFDQAGLQVADEIPMPANNLTQIARKPR
ncbi:DUF938 domain-containing protein [Rhodovulum adriaticum]|uniref:Uncharacterized protein DUF938 n=1 Tax=Rhodovulum adriaticum TaxID=35804 RepID=A0A4R2NY98_RHOAD|nr:DUF938 domain-containing protein [Rhodovulum adriaticum]MBK1636235.1 methyltransferase [Rhodovulum adriaticum]TCP26511.1 uncharacterized protein DUF938 [Rhodovulum adriaticum]